MIINKSFWKKVADLWCTDTDGIVIPSVIDEIVLNNVENELLEENLDAQLKDIDW